MADRTILVASDLSARSDRPLERALLLAGRLGASLIVLHVPPKTLESAEEDHLASRFNREFDLSGVQSEIVFAYGSIPAAVANTAKERGCELVITGVARFDSPRDYILGTTVDFLVRRSPAPVLVVKCRARKPYRRLLVATDFSDCSAEALSAAAELFPDAELRLLHSFHAAWQAFLSPETTEPVARKDAERAMADFLDSRPKALRERVEPMLEEGHLGTIVAQQEENWGADLLVLGSHGRNGFVHATIGDTAAQLLNSVPTDVLVVRGSLGRSD